MVISRVIVVPNVCLVQRDEWISGDEKFKSIENEEREREREREKRKKEKRREEGESRVPFWQLSPPKLGRQLQEKSSLEPPVHSPPFWQV